MGRAPRNQQRDAANARAARAHVDVPWDDAIQQVLREANDALRPSDLSERIVASGLRRAVGATPAATVASYLIVSLREENSPYLRPSRGLYTLKEMDGGAQAAQFAEDEERGPAETGALKAFGMYWKRDSIVWTGAPRLTGRQGDGASDVNFAAQIGVYLLHDRERVIYVGRASDTLYARLKAHTADRLSGRWDRFSWFGLRAVNEDGDLRDNDVPWTQNVVIETMEALLIESLEPPLNRRRGDNFSAAEFVQVADPQIERARRQALLDDLRRNMNL